VYYALCMLRPFTGMTVLAAIVMLSMSIVVFAHPEAARNAVAGAWPDEHLRCRRRARPRRGRLRFLSDPSSRHSNPLEACKAIDAAWPW
jgi:hypothetical protein